MTPCSIRAVMVRCGNLAENRRSVGMIETMSSSDRFVAAVCHGPGVFRHTKAQDGTPLVKGKSVTGFSNRKRLPSA